MLRWNVWPQLPLPLRQPTFDHGVIPKASLLISVRLVCYRAACSDCIKTPAVLFQLSIKHQHPPKNAVDLSNQNTALLHFFRCKYLGAALALLIKHFWLQTQRAARFVFVVRRLWGQTSAAGIEISILAFICRS